jgi:DNA-binding transcriptional ArsR family regulator
VSHHIKTLTESGLIIPEKEGRNYTYVLNQSLFEQYIQEIGTLIKQGVQNSDDICLP